MAFTFNAEDIAMGAKGLGYAGKYNVMISDIRDAKQTKNGWDMRTIQFEVQDGSEKGATIMHNFMDDSQTTSGRPFRYREINAMLAATGGNFVGVTIDISNDEFMNKLKQAKFAVEVNEFEKSVDNDGKLHFNPRISGFGKVMPASEPDLNSPRPSANNAQANDPFTGAQPVSDKEMNDIFGPNNASDPFA
ncbi:putative phage tail protein [Weissella oryzae SG25]|uniref:Putative phage tail protein n=1 Tax=Weissella oryzae (strain DSM 25784 / JCM 18191 / LMG 30913 / SG25) TaxID=1329250 RepID=A0A069CX33_WEIOS|nr:DUF669 domain-containing protein [Weissella oryzae]GAK32039.1 putative phage tail protein [Weissella oryzae SG25]